MDADEYKDLPITPEKVAVIIVNYNAGAFIERCLSSVQQQTFRSFRTIVVDNCSTDGSVDDIEIRFPGVEIIRLAQNTGFAAGNNIGVAAAAGCDWIACLNPDAFPAEDWLEKLMAEAGKNPGYAFFGSRLMRADHPGILDGTGDIYHISGMAWRRDHNAQVDQGTKTKGEIFAPCAAAALYRLDVFNELDGFDESFFCYFEDVDLGFRFRLAGHRCLYVHDSVAFHIGSATTGTRSDFSVYHGHRNLVWSFVKNMPGVLFWALLPAHLLLNFAAIIYFSIQGKGKLILLAKRDAIRGIPAMWKKRRHIQARRRVPWLDIWRVLDKKLVLPGISRRLQPVAGTK
ncbi:MAG: N-acetylglucosaminyl-diphospho-decaprenol L-rhamnosyltransferase [Herminiimonas sp.]|nr:N-acetylglucosaminyl-diphospho-decaprenol L-rhamnosyltransferase [Herminiimonas sp.]